MSRRLLVPLLFAPLLLLALSPSPVRASASEDLSKAWQAFLALTSFRAEIQTLEPAGATTRIEFRAPDRYRVSVVNGPTTVIIGDSGYMEIGGRMMKLPLALESITAQYRDEAFLRELSEGLAVEDLGADQLDGEAVRKFRYVQDATPPPSLPGAPAAASGGQVTTVAWVSGKTGLILKLDVTGTHGGTPTRTQIRYSDFNSASIRIEPPA